jgi:hypothetical protein
LQGTPPQTNQETRAPQVSILGNNIRGYPIPGLALLTFILLSMSLPKQGCIQ